MKLIQKYFDSSVRHISKHQRYVLNWLVFFVVSYVILWALGAIGAILEILRINVPFDFFNFFYLGLTILTISIGIFALRRPSVLFKQIQSRKAESEPIKRPEAPDYSGSGNEDLQKIMDYLEKDKAYLKNDLSMRDMVDATGLSKHRISEFLNKELGKNFYEILNEYRTREAIRLFNDGKHTNFTLTYIGEMAGFNSRATFNRIFKKITNQTPTEYIHSIYLDEKNKESES
jgi:AraC-like DNA-binding protein